MVSEWDEHKPGGSQQMEAGQSPEGYSFPGSLESCVRGIEGALHAQQRIAPG